MDQGSAKNPQYKRNKLIQLIHVGKAKMALGRVKNWRDVEAYVEERGFENMDNFLNKASEWYMRKYHLSAMQKARIDKNIEK